QRSGNSNTAFSFEYALDVEGKTAGKTNADYVNFAAAAAETGLLSYSAGGSNTAQLTFRTIDTLEPLASVGLRLTLKNPSTPRTVGMGVLTNTNLDNSINRTDAVVTVLNTKDLIQDNYSISLNDGGTVSTFAVSGDDAEPAYQVALKQQSPVRKSINWSFTLPAKNTLDIDHSKIRYSWRLLNSAGTADANWSDGVVTRTGESDGSFTNGSGVADYGLSGVQEADTPLLVQGSFKIPFVLNPTQFSLELKLEGGNGSNFSEVWTRTIRFTALPLFRELYMTGQNDSYCLRPQGRGDCGYDATRWSWNPDHQALINYELRTNTNKCYYISGSSSEVRNCSNIDPVSFPGSNLGVGSDVVCRELAGFSYRYGRKSAGWCTAGDKNW